MSDTARNLIQMTVSSVASAGLGTLTLGSAVADYLAFEAGDDGLTFTVTITETGAGQEVNTGCTYTHSGTTLTRGTLEKSTTGAAIAFSSAAIVSVTASAGWGNSVERLMRGLIPGGLLTTESGVPVSTSDRTAQSTIYYTPFRHDQIALWDGAKWRPYTFTETSLALSGLTSGKPYDVFGYVSSGVLALELLVWTDDTTRATAVTLQDGRYCKSGDKTRLLLGTIYTTATTTTEDSEAKRYVCNVYNAVPRRILSAISATYSHTYTTGTWREWNAGTGVVRPSFVSALPVGTANFGFLANLSAASAQPQGILNLQIDGTDGSARLSATNFLLYGTNVVLTAYLPSSGITAGKHYVALVEYGNAGSTYYSADVFGTVSC